METNSPSSSAHSVKTEKIPNPPQANHSTNLINGLDALRKSGLLFDITLKVDGQSFQAHKVVLAACSAYFSAMFTDGLLESKQSEVNLIGLNSRGLEVILDYVYTSNLELNNENVQDVLAVASHVQLDAVVEACGNFMESNIDLENCVAISILADLYSLEPLKKKCCRFLLSRFSEFTKSFEFFNLSLEQLETLLSSNYPINCRELLVAEFTLKYCINNKVKLANAEKLFSLIHFDQIGLKSFNESFNLDAQNETERSKVSPESLIYYQIIRDEFAKQETSKNIMLEGKVLTRDNNEGDYNCTMSILTNSRGMEIALVKIGGFEANGLTNKISCYLPSKGVWENLTVIPHLDQCNYGTAVLGNDLFIVGGSYDVCLKEYIHPFGFRYCPTKGRWTSIAQIQADRCRFSLNAVGHFLYAVGGVCEATEGSTDNDNWAYEMPVSNCERYDSKLNRWEYLPSFPESRSQHAGAVIGTDIFITGGINRQHVLASVWRLDTTTFDWIKASPMLTPRADHVLISYRDKIYACGGWYEDSSTELRVLCETVEVYDPKYDKWLVETFNPLPKFYSGIANVRDKIYFLGGLLSHTKFNRATSNVQCYDLSTKKWTVHTEMEFPNELWESACVAFYVPTERDDLAYFMAEEEYN